MARLLANKGRQVLEETIAPDETSLPVKFYNPESKGTVTELYAGHGYVQHTLAEDVTATSDWHDWDPGTVSAYTVWRILSTRGAVRFRATSVSASFRISL